jgi:hypothetical protein
MKPHLTVGKNSILMKVGNPQHAHDFIGFPVRHGALCVDFAKNLTKLLVLEIAQFLPGYDNQVMIKQRLAKFGFYRLARRFMQIDICYFGTQSIGDPTNL